MKNKFILILFLLFSFVFIAESSNAKDSDEGSGKTKTAVKRRSAVQKAEKKQIISEPDKNSVPLKSAPSTTTQDIAPNVTNTIPEESSNLAGEQINWQVFSGGFSTGSTNGFNLSSITGQQIVGDGTSGDIFLSTGFYQNFIVETCCVGIRGNIDGGIDEGGIESINITDLVYLIAFTFLMQPPPPCDIEADIDASGEVDIADIVQLVDFMFNEGPPPFDCP